MASDAEPNRRIWERLALPARCSIFVVGILCVVPPLWATRLLTPDGVAGDLHPLAHLSAAFFGSLVVTGPLWLYSVWQITSQIRVDNSENRFVFAYVIAAFPAAYVAWAFAGLVVWPYLHSSWPANSAAMEFVGLDRVSILEKVGLAVMVVLAFLSTHAWAILRKIPDAKNDQIVGPLLIMMLCIAVAVLHVPLYFWAILSISLLLLWAFPPRSGPLTHFWLAIPVAAGLAAVVRGEGPWLGIVIAAGAIAFRHTAARIVEANELPWGNASQPGGTAAATAPPVATSAVSHSPAPDWLGFRAQTPRMFEALLEGVEAASLEVRLQSVRHLPATKDLQALKQLSEIASSSSQPVAVRLAAVEGLGRFGDQAARTLLTGLIADRELAVRWRARSILTHPQTGPQPELAALVPIQPHEDPLVHIL